MTRRKRKDKTPGPLTIRVPFNPAANRGHGSPSRWPSVGVFSDGEGDWEVRTGNRARPDGFVVTSDAGTTFEIDTAATSGLTLQVVDGRPEVVYP